MRQNERGTRKQMDLAAESVGKALQLVMCLLNKLAKMFYRRYICAIVEYIDKRVTMHCQFTALQLLR